MAGDKKYYTLAEVSTHCDRKDCWLLIDGKMDYTKPVPSRLALFDSSLK